MADDEKASLATGTTTKRPRFFSRYIPVYESQHAARHLCSALLILAILAGVTALALYLVYRPSHPRFSIANAAVYSLDSSPDSEPTVASASVQFTLVSRNPSGHTSILYDGLSAYVVYRNQPITPPVSLPPLVQEGDSSASVSPVMGGEYVPVSKEVAAALQTDSGFGVVGLRLVLMGRVKYRSGPFRSAWHGLYVRCDALLGVRKGVAGQAPLIGEPQCNVDA